MSVNGTEASGLSNLQGRLNEIFAQGVVEWDVAPMQNITVRNVDEANLDDGGSGLLSNYTEDMKKILRSYTNDNTLAENTYYLFLVKNSTSKNKLGYMPRSKQAGFIFVEAHKNDNIAQTIAHELGHGAFHLRHTFFENNIGQGTTENLMDYPARHRLDKWQWDKIHNPERVS